MIKKMGITFITLVTFVGSILVPIRSQAIDFGGTDSDVLNGSIFEIGFIGFMPPSGWRIETVDSTGDVGQFTDIALDSSGNPHIIYYDKTHRDLRYAYRSDHWVASTIATEDDSGKYGSLTIDPSNTLHVSYYGLKDAFYFSDGQGTLNYMKKTGEGAWSFPAEIASDGRNEFGRHTSIVTYHDNIFITHEGEGSVVRLASKEEGSPWSFESATTPSTGGHNSIDVDASGNLHFCWYHDGSIFYHSKEVDGEWTLVEVVDFSLSPDKGAYCSLKVTGSSKGSQIHIAYYDKEFRDLRYTYRDQPNPLMWQSERVDGVGEDLGEYTSLDLDAETKPRISYYDASNSALKYAERTETSWNIVTVDNTDAVGKYTSLAYDKQRDCAHISYYDENHKDLKYATNCSEPTEVTEPSDTEPVVEPDTEVEPDTTEGEAGTVAPDPATPDPIAPDPVTPEPEGAVVPNEVPATSDAPAMPEAPAIPETPIENETPETLPDTTEDTTGNGQVPPEVVVGEPDVLVPNAEVSLNTVDAAQGGGGCSLILR